MNTPARELHQTTAPMESYRLDNIRRDLNRDVWCVLGLPFDATTESATCEHLLNCIDTRQKCFFTTPNLNFAITASRDQAFRQSVIDSDWVVADGMPLIWVAKKLGIPLKERVAGSSVFEALRQDARRKQRKLRIVFFGGPDGVAAEAFKKIALEDSAMEVVGFFSPGFGSVEEMSPQHVIDQINESEADMVVVALGAKRGQAWIEFNRERLNAPILTHLGAVVNFVAGTVNRAPLWMQKTGLEWAWRIWEERSLMQRYWHDGLAFIRILRESVLPYSRYLANMDARQHTNAVHQVQILEDQISIKLQGAYSFNNLDELRTSVIQHLSLGRPFRLKCSEVSHIDGAFLGLMLLIKRHLAARDQTIQLIDCSPTVQSILAFNRLDSHLDSIG